MYSSYGAHDMAAGARRYAGFWIRFAACAIDNFLLMFALMPLSVGAALVAAVTAQAAPDSDAIPAVLVATVLAAVVMWWLYFTMFESSRARGTPGKWILGLRVTDEEGARIGFGRANARFWSKLLSGLSTVGYILAAFQPRKQALHDTIARTLVIRESRAPAAGA